MLVFFSIALFLSALLLFTVEPMFARLALPLLGGSPSVWTVCVVFFQATLLAGYLYVHASARYLRLRTQVLLHALVLLLPLVVLPTSIVGWHPPELTNPTLWLLWLLAAGIGLPFFAIACTAPLLQYWFGLGGHRDSHDPYFLYATSNAGSLIGLLAFPFVLEPLLPLERQAELWLFGYVALVVLIAGCAGLAWRRAAAMPAGFSAVPVPANPGDDARGPVTPLRRAWWCALAFAPSSLMLGVTSFASTDIAVIPMLWVIPLALYLLSFIFVFARRQLIPRVWMLRALPIFVSFSAVLQLMEAVQPVALVLPVHLAATFVACMVCHGELADRRPSAAYLTEFYLWMGIGGVLGGVFNALVAPFLFTGIAEFPLAMVLACVLAAGAGSRLVGWRGLVPSDISVPLGVALLSAAGIAAAQSYRSGPGGASILLAAGLPVLLAYVASNRLLRFGLTIGAVLMVGSFDNFNRGQQLEASRTFFGTHRVLRHEIDAGADVGRVSVNSLYHGSTLHGSQLVGSDGGLSAHSGIPTAYYHRDGPIGDVMAAWVSGRADRQVGVVGLGAGALAAYAEPGQRFEYFEIDPVVARIAQDRRYFHFLGAARQRGATVDIVLGDARHQLQAVADGAFDLLVLDAFSSDAVPLHLLSREAVQLYVDKLAPEGVLAFHLSNRHFELEPAMGAVANSLNLAALFREDRTGTDDGVVHRGSSWLVMARHENDLVPLAVSDRGGQWRRASVGRGGAVWTDDYSSLLSAFVW